MRHKLCAAVCILLSIVLLASLAACSESNVGKKKNIAVIVKSEDSEFWKAVETGVNAAATEYNVSVTFEGPQNEEDYMTQNKMIESAINRNVDSIIISAIDYNRCSDAISRAAQKGIKIIAIDSTVSSPAVNMFVGTDNYSAGKSAGQACVENFSNDEKICIGIVNYSKDTENGQRREEGFREYISGVENAEIVGVVNIDSSVESATVGALKLLNENPEINVLVGFNEFMSLGIGNAISQKGLSDSVVGVGFDSNVNSIEMLESGEMDALVVQNPFAIGYLGIQNAVNLINGNTKETTVYTPISLITKENMFDEENQKLLFKFQ